MTYINDLMTGWELDPTAVAPTVVAGLSLLVAAIAIWAFVRVRRLLAVLPALEERAAVLNHSLSLLTDTTESCFKALAMQLQFMQTQHVLRSSRATAASVKPRRAAAERPRTGKTVGAARRRAALAAIPTSDSTAAKDAAIPGVNGNVATPGPAARFATLFS